MKKVSPSPYFESCRITTGPLASDASYGYTGAFTFRYKDQALHVVASDGKDWDLEGLPWDHVSVSCPTRCPTWTELDWIKDAFWDADETVIQFHVPKDKHLNYHQFCLHLWKPVGLEIPLPTSITVGPP